MENLARVSIVILNRNGVGDLLLCLDSIRRSSYTGFSVVIVDNGSIDESLERLFHYVEKNWKLSLKSRIKEFVFGGNEAEVYSFSGDIFLTVISLSENSGVSGGRNIGGAWALEREDPDYLFFLDNDAQVDPEAVSNSVDLSRKENAEVVGSLIRKTNNEIEFSGLKFRQNIFYLDKLARRKLYDASRDFWETDFVSGCAFLCSRKIAAGLFLKRGYMFPDYFLYAEDQEFSLAAKSLGAKILLSGRSVVYHKISRGGAGLDSAYYYSSRNRMRLANQYLPTPLKIIFHIYYPLFRLTRSVLNLLRRGDPAVSLAHLQGLIDGYKGVAGKWSRHGGV